MPTISVIIPCFNAQSTIIRALDSVLAQSYKEYDIICIDDGSEDSTKELIEQYIKQNPNFSIEYIYQTNQGPSKARNIGVTTSKSEYVAFLDADDEWHRDKLTIESQILKKNNMNFLGSKYQYASFTKELHEPITHKYNFSKLLIKNRFSTPGVVMKKSFFDKIGGFDESLRYAEDYDLWLRASLVEELCCIEAPSLVQLHKHAYGASGLSSHMLKMFSAELKVLNKLYMNQDVNFIEYILYRSYFSLKFILRFIKSLLK